MHPAVRAALFFFSAPLLPFGSVHAQLYAVRSDSATVQVEVPVAVVARFKTVFPVIPRDTIVRWEVYGPARQRSFLAHVGLQNAVFDATGQLKESELEIPLSALPKRVQRRVQKSILNDWHHAKPGVIRAYVSLSEGDVWYYIIRYCDPLNESIYKKRDLRITPDGHFFNPKFR